MRSFPGLDAGMLRPLRHGLVVGLLALACTRGPHDSAAWRGRIDTLDNGAVLVRNPTQGLWDSATAWRLVDERKIGSVEGPGPDAFGQVQDVEVDGSGRMYVLDGQSQDIRVFDAEGNHVRTIGRPGRGPGEFRLPLALALDPLSRLWVIDQANGRYAVLDTSGTPLKTFPRRSGVLIAAGTAGWIARFTRSGALLEQALIPSALAEGVVRFDTVAGAFVDTLRLPQRNLGLREYRDARGRTVRAPPTSTATRHWTVSPDGMVWIGWSDDHRIYGISLAGDTVGIIERHFEPVQMTPVERDSVLEQTRQMLGPRIGRDDVPDHRATIGHLVVDDAGYLWIERPGAAGPGATLFEVFDTSGRYLGQVHGGHSLGRVAPLIRGDQMYLATVDEFDVAYVVRLTIEGRRGRLAPP